MVAIARPGSATDFELELAQIDRDVSKLEGCVDPESRVRLAYRLYHRASVCGDLEGLAAVESIIAEALERSLPKEDLCLLKANLDFKLHRLEAARRDLELAPALPARFEARTLLAEIDFQEGRYSHGQAALEELIAENRTWDNLARLAHWLGKIGETEAADRLYLEAEDELTAKEMRSFAWVELQRGVLDLTRGRYADAAAHYRCAAAAYSGYWHVEEHRAKLCNAQGEHEEAARLYQSILERVPKPELQQELGELYRHMGQHQRAGILLNRALESYVASARRGDVHYYHHLADFYAHAQPDSAEALKWARLDVKLRSNYSTQAALAGALYRTGEAREAAFFMDRALESGVRDPTLFLQAAEIYGDDRYRKMAEEINPRHEHIHVHVH
jgi:tetratricopeptide (TPR) repeat protein